MNKKHLIAAEAHFKTKGANTAGMPIVSAEHIATREKTARLRALRLAKETEDNLRKPRAKRSAHLHHSR